MEHIDRISRTSKLSTEIVSSSEHEFPTVQWGMLERASACLEYGSRQLFRKPHSTKRSRRALHSAFWHHTGGDLDLGSWWTSVLRSTRELESHVEQSHVAQQELRAEALDIGSAHGESEPLLEFLYPPKTLTLIRKISNFGIDRWDCGRLPSAAFGHINRINRTYSSTAVLSESPPFIADSEKISKGVSQEEDIIVQKLSVHSDSTPRRTQYTSRSELEEEVKNYESLRDRCACQYQGGVLLQHVLVLQQWDLAERVFSKYVAVVQPKNNSDTDNLWTPASRRLNLREDAFSLLGYVEKALKDLAPKLDSLRDFTTQFLFRALGHQLLTPDHGIVEVFQRLQLFDWVSSYLFEKVLIKQLNMPDMRPSRNRPILGLYSLYRANSDFHPSEKLLTLLLSRACQVLVAGQHSKDLSIDLLVHEWRQTHGKLHVKAFGILMLNYAKLGNVKMVHTYFDELRKEYPEHVTIDFCWPLFNVHAQRAEIKEIRGLFQLISKEYGLKPDRRCWNMLLHTYAKADDLEGASQAYEEMVNKKIDPDEYTLGPLMSLWALRGDVDMVKQLFLVAQARGIPISPPMVGSKVLAYIRNGNLALAERIARSAMEKYGQAQPVNSWVGVWNHVLTGYALEGDTKSAMQVFNFMEDKNMEPDGMTYAALMQCMVNVRKTHIARMILRRVLKEKNIQPLAFHYAIIIQGFYHQGDTDAAQRVYQTMLQRGIRPTISTEAVRLRAKAVKDKRHIQKLGLSVHSAQDLRLADRKAILAEFEQGLATADLAVKQPKVGLMNTLPNEAYSAIFIQHLLSTYGAEQMRQLVETELQQRAVDGQKSPSPLPMRVAYSFMHGYHQAGKHEEVEKFWTLLLEKARDLARIGWLPASLNGLVAQDTKSSQADGDTIAREDIMSSSTCGDEFTRPAPARRGILSRPLSVYLESLITQKRYDDARSTVSSILADGFLLENKAWNQYIEILLRSGHIEQAFRTCEQHLMPHWQKWEECVANTSMDSNSGEDVLSINAKPAFPKPNTLFLKSHTIDRLAAVLQRAIREQEDRLLKAHDKVSLEDLKMAAPKTVAAVGRLRRLTKTYDSFEAADSRDSG